MTFPEYLHIVHLNSIDSTNDYIKKNHQALSLHFPVMVHSDIQTSGRGRNGRHWNSPIGSGLYTSFGFSLNNKSKLGLLPLMTGIAVVETFLQFGEKLLLIKWPNDIMFKNRKVAGILTETIICGECLTCISGIGININQDLQDFPVHLQGTAISIKAIYGNQFSIEDIQVMLSRGFFKWLDKLERGEDTAITDAINRMCYHSKGDQITFHQGQRIIKGSFIRIDRDGGLILQEEGKQRSYYSGEIQIERL